jgi:hypothetical protein
VSFAYPVAWWAVLMGAAVALGLAVLACWRARALLTRTRVAALVTLRTLTLIAVCAMLLRPVHVVREPQVAGTVPILVDASASMSIADEGGKSRFEAALDAVRRDILPSLAPTFVPEVLAFGDGVSSLDLEVPPQPSQGASRLDRALREVRQRARTRPVAGIVIVSDGAVRLDELKGSAGVPVFTIAVGSTEPQQDREVYGATIGDARLAGSLVDLSALVAVHGERRSPVEVSISEAGRPVDVRRLVPAGDGSPLRISARVAPSRTTPTVYSIGVAQRDGEITTRNNEQQVLAPPAGAPRRVLIVEGAPGFEHGFLKRSLQEDAGVSVDAVVRKGSNDQGRETYYVQTSAGPADQLTEGFPATKAALFGYDVVMLANLSADLLTREQMSQLQEFVAVRGGGVIVLGARSFDSRGLTGTPLEDLVAVELVDRGRGLARVVATTGRGEPFRVGLTPEGEDHPIMRLGAAAGDTRKAWAAAPALSAVAALGDPRPGTTLLATTTAAGGVVRPLVAVQRYGRGRAVTFGGEASWRWKMMRPAGDLTYDNFWRQAVRWAGGDATGPVAVSPSVDGHTIAFDVEVRDAEFAPARDAQVSLRLFDPSGRRHELTVSRAQDRAGALATSFEAAESGVYRAVVEGRRGETSLGTAETWLLVGGTQPEFVNPWRDEVTLRRLVEAAGGAALTLADVPRLPALLSEAVRRPETVVEKEVWHTPWAFLMLIALLAAEWTLRRRWGLR